MGDPVIIAIVSGAALLIVLTLIVRLWNRRREATYYARRRVELRKQRSYLRVQQQEIERLANRIIATSSTGSIAGFTIVRQIEALFTDGHPSPSKAVEFLKATAAQKGANAVINLGSARPPSGKCLAHGDAVIVRSINEETSPAMPLPPLPIAPRPTDEHDST
ncbi:MAG: hypothetical protein ACE5I3_01670 [Phycisphaerae bacterium]